VDEQPAPELRIGDRERRATDAHLQQAHADGVLTLTEYDERAARCWAARTQSELDALVADLPPYRPGPDEQPTAVVAEPEAKPAKGFLRKLGDGLVAVAVAAAMLFLGSQVIADADAAAVFGNGRVAVAPGQQRVEAGVIFGSVEVVVPEGMRARPTGAVVFGSTACELACTGAGPEVVVNTRGAFGSVDIVRPGEPDLHHDEDDDEDEDD
jgi:hypothetical protein